MATVLPATLGEIRYKVETTYRTEVTADLAFGHGTKITSLTRSNNIEPIFTTGLRNSQKLVEKQFGGALSIEFVLSSPWFLRLVLGKTAVTTGAAPETHTYSESDTVDSFTIENELNSSTKSVVAFLGCKVNTCTITARLNELIKVRLDILYADEVEDTTTADDKQESEEPMNFANATLEFPNATTISDIQEVELVINNNLEMAYALGDRRGQQLVPKNRSYTGRINRTFDDAATFLEAFYGKGTGPLPDTAIAETATMELVCSNNGAGAAERLIPFLFTGVKIDEHNMPQDPTALILEDLPVVMRSLEVAAVNDTNAEP